MARSITMWPSRMPRTASAIGSLWSSPSTSTVKMPVMVPSPGAGAGALQQPRQLGEDRRRIALGGRRLAGGKADLALRHGEAGDRVHQQQHVLVLVAEVFGDGQRQVGGLAAHQRRLVGGRDHHDRAGQALLAEVVLEEFLHLAAALADQPDHRDVGHDVAGQHRQQHRLADAGAGEDAHALAVAAGDEDVQRANAEVERRADAPAGMGRRRRRRGTDRASAPAAAGPCRRSARPWR